MIRITAPKWYDLTISKDAMRKAVVEMGFISAPEFYEEWLEKHLQEVLDKICERYAYGNEEGKEGYKHFQCRIVLSKPTEEAALRLYLGMAGIPAHTSPTSVRNFDYVLKEGNYYCSWEAVLNKFARGTPTMWQLIALDMWNKQNQREILIISDEKGRHGKSWLRKYMVATHKAAFIPPLEKAEDIMAMAMAKPSKGYVIDMPRAEGKVKKAMWSAIEQIKDGYLYDKRYQWKEKWIDPPKVMVFCNDYNENNLTSDRWVPLDITDFPQEFRYHGNKNNERRRRRDQNGRIQSGRQIHRGVHTQRNQRSLHERIRERIQRRTQGRHKRNRHHHKRLKPNGECLNATA